MHALLCSPIYPETPLIKPVKQISQLNSVHMTAVKPFKQDFMEDWHRENHLLFFPDTEDIFEARMKKKWQQQPMFFAFISF